MHDPISDLISRIKNAQARKHPSVIIPMSKVKHAIAEVLNEAGYIDSVKVIKSQPSDSLELKLKYRDSAPAITHFRRISKSGNRIYRNLSNFPRPLSGHGLVIVSTSKGVMSGESARKQNVGGEIVATVW